MGGPKSEAMVTSLGKWDGSFSFTQAKPTGFSGPLDAQGVNQTVNSFAGNIEPVAKKATVKNNERDFDSNIGGGIGVIWG